VVEKVAPVFPLLSNITGCEERGIFFKKGDKPKFIGSVELLAGLP
jgi:hypothetical protein